MTPDVNVFEGSQELGAARFLISTIMQEQQRGIPKDSLLPQ
jgi:hypothetical protein